MATLSNADSVALVRNMLILRGLLVKPHDFTKFGQELVSSVLEQGHCLSNKVADALADYFKLTVAQMYAVPEGDEEKHGWQLAEAALKNVRHQQVKINLAIYLNRMRMEEMKDPEYWDRIE